MKALSSMISGFFRNRQYRHCFFFVIGMIVLFYALLYLAYIWKSI